MTKVAQRAASRWERAVREHQAALASFLVTAQTVPAAAWDQPMGEGKWSPGDVCEHLALSYEAVLREHAGGERMQPRVSARWQTLLRWFLLPHMLFHRSMPRVRAPREVRPEPTGRSRTEAVERLERLAREAEEAFGAAPDAQLTHPHFGPLDRARAFRLVALHIDHHHRQVMTAKARGEGFTAKAQRKSNG